MIILCLWLYLHLNLQNFLSLPCAAFYQVTSFKNLNINSGKHVVVMDKQGKLWVCLHVASIYEKLDFACSESVCLAHTSWEH